jgi:lysosomal acid phosphatase
MTCRKLILMMVILCFTIQARSEEKLIFAIDLIRHGDRTPIHPIPTISYQWKEGLGQLTPEGMREEYELGKQLRQKYVDQYHLLPPNYETETMYVRSTDYDRTLMSAESLLMGLYPLGAGPFLSGTKQFALPSAYQPIPIHTVAKNRDTIFVPSIDQEKQEALLEKYVFSNPEWKKKNAQLQSKYPAWSEATGIKIKTLRQLSSLGGTLSIHQSHHVPLPIKLSSTDVNDIITMGKWVIAAKYRPKEIGRENGRPLLIVVTDYLQQAIRGVGQLKYVLLSGHDTTILSIMSAMRTPLSLPPPYAADLNFSLYQRSPKEYVVRVSLNGQPIILPGCKTLNCPWEQFKKMIR